SVFFNELEIRKPDYDLKIKTGKYGPEVSDIITKSEEVLLKEKPNVLLILGDTNSGLAAIPAAHHKIKIVHLEAGMRSYDFRMPEEKNRIIIDHLSSLLLPYTTYSRENLIRENIHPGKIYVVGNPIIDVINYFSPKIESSNIMEKIFSSLQAIGKRFKKRVIYPIHPRTLSKIKKRKIPGNLELMKPLGFFDFSKLEKNAFCLITDSGTVPEEALYFKKPCVTIRESTERPEYIEEGANILAGLNPKNVETAVKVITSHENDLEWNRSLGDGKTALRVANILSGKIDRLQY
ncbi:MAG: UDP-N-acetyl glucosamine 2-epimerase, partial [Thaumarchaeota archaeon]|nr:UDP-N-acetyl glucosamine 2-epimerase [Nitrososphaerota archaeon]